MGVKHGRNYDDILREFTTAVGQITDCYEFFEMEQGEWEQLPEEGKKEVLEALAEDLFYGLGTDSMIKVGSGVVIYDRDIHRINVLIGEEEITFVSLI
ncbi:hypothetical protein [Paenibacillus sp. IHBB 10380]|uniref:hypothetical protein n=1 Tax=Paenibacillus sp. IHBB 10380 TaxID=1566358 RepID=UPI0005CFC246|nr:hypothetical protein [Paenibacillus sp. IHBB 10380]AJS60777.1 hypothetical protein UB51_22565 [Paenibacillus sp. IHBB 10380]